MISIKSCNPFSRSECLAITEESCSFDSNIVFEFYCLLWLFAKLIKFLDYVLFLQVQTHFLEQYLNLRIFDDQNGVMNRSVLETGGDIMVVSQFTLHASTKKGNR